MQEKYQHYETLVGEVENTIAKIKALPIAKCYDTHFLETEFIPSLGLNNEYLEQQPAELSPYFGKGLHLWQYPSQLSRYLVWLAHNAREIRTFSEIGCRWGGTFILVNEWLKKIGAPLEFSLAIDPIEPTPFVRKYIEISSTPVHYIKNFSTSQEVIDYMSMLKPEMVFIDGDHSLQGVMFDHLLVRKTAKIIVHHDVASQACPGTSVFWSYVKQAESDFFAWEFTQQYPSVSGNFLGIGALKRL